MPDLPPTFWIIAASLLGLVVGSLLNVIILRLPARMEAEWRRQAQDILEQARDTQPLPPGIVYVRSHCPQCKHPLSPGDNIPLLSWLLLRGRCRYCKHRISLQYPLVEALSAVLSALVVARFGPSAAALAGLFLTWTLIALAGIDLRTRLLPDQINYPLLWLGLLLSTLSLFVPPGAAILGTAAGYLCLWSVYWLFKLLTGKEGMGYGDFKLLAALGAWLGPSALLPIILLSSLAGTLIGLTLMILRRQQRGAQIPFGPYIAAAGWIWFMVGDRLAACYMSWLGLH